ncbi:hypothetical protein AAFN85_16260 [Mucilaginibacter sp. CAU 1740]|uniref:hypothetical protein n=1 Tax=Mucilaginibacter sp. CAU 1740 TaxID=3140365 RepID=UPI00325A880F
MLPDPCLESLKVLVLVNGNTLLTAPYEAKQLATLIDSRTQHPVAEITILRLFGFVAAKFPPSAYTKDVLAQFCGYSDYAMFCEDQRV